MWHPVASITVALLLAQLSGAQGCRETRTPVEPAPAAPVPAPSPGPAPAVETFTTRDGVRFRVEVVVSRLEIPWSMAFAPDGRLFVTERPGRVVIIDLAAARTDLALTLEDTFQQGEAGAMGLALDPGFSQNRLVYLYYTATSGGRAANRLVRYREVGGRLAERAVLLDGVPANAIHDGGRIRFGPDGLLYVTTGDAAATSLAQDVGSLAGKILRLNRDGTSPAGNPYASPIYSYGHRNPQGIDWHPVTGLLWASEHGPVGDDEINVIRAGANHGWPRIQGAASQAGMETPIAFFQPAIAPSGASFYRGGAFPQFANDLFVATLRGAHLLRVTPDPSAPARIAAQERLLDQRYGRIRDVAAGPDGYVYFATNNRDGRGSPAADDDRIARLVPVP